MYANFLKGSVYCVKKSGIGVSGKFDPIHNAKDISYLN